MTVNNVTRMLAGRKIRHEVFVLPEEKLGAQKTAALLGVPLDIVCKTIVVKRAAPGKPILAVIAGNRSADLKKIAAAIKEKKVTLATEHEAEEITGLLAGGISPLALLNKGFQVLIDDSLRSYTEIHISGGQRGLNIKIALADLLKLTNAKIAPVSTEAQANEQL